MMFRGWGVKTRDVSRLLTGHLLRARGRQVTLWGGEDVKMTLFSAKNSLDKPPYKNRLFKVVPVLR